MADPNKTHPPAPDDAEEERPYAEQFRTERLPKTDDGLNAEIEDEEVLVDETIDQTFPASDPAPMRSPAKKDATGEPSGSR